MTEISLVMKVKGPPAGGPGRSSGADLSAADAAEVFALAAAILALGAVYWLVRDQDRRES
jgi:Phosphate-starvation-inducible E family